MYSLVGILQLKHLAKLYSTILQLGSQYTISKELRGDAKSKEKRKEGT